MKVPERPYRCPLARLQPQTMDPERIKRAGWRDEHILVIAANDARLDFVEREIVERIGRRLYGGRDE